MSKRNPKILKIFLYMLLLNSLFLIIYFVFHSSSSSSSSSPEQPNPHISLVRFHVSVNNNQSAIQKPWPILPSYLPWTPPQRNLPTRSCEGYFGNGFTKRVDFLKPMIGGEGSWFRCFYSETLQSSICEGRNLRMVPDRIVMSRGGERLEEVMGRREEEELPEFRDGAFEVAEEVSSRLGFKRHRRIGGGGGNDVISRRLVNDELLNEYVQEGGIGRHTMRGLVASIRAVDSKDFVCEEWVEEPTLLITRFEYANLFHTVTDWYSAYVSSRVTGLPNRPHVVFVDGHCTTQLEETWTALFSGIRYAKNFTKPVCFRHAILSPLGYETALFKGLTGDIDCKGESAQNLWQNPDDKRTARISEFGEMIRAAFGFPVNRHRSSERPPSSSSSSVHNVLFVRREDYLAHPRHGGKVQSRLINEEEVFDSLHHWVASGSTGLTKCGINLVNGLFAHMSMKDQVRAIQDASVIIGAHGAGLTHIVSATPNTTIFEIISVEFQRPHFELIAKWKGLEYHAMHLANSRADPTAVIEKLKEIMKSLGC
ncbi:PREDICTED: beta-(1,2)-xylosyltransferase [Camelina sativa]|uniref:Beta-(1,2)-xylosyltransferase n=1 Tax=Camelina sativa TaxID=90675 RepID=A0ABM0XAB0_CAMSA|nr:PREDICTED: beta-(1,2)-xylosyltransferase [Camelina sativa]